MKKAAFLTMEDLTGFECYDDLLINPLNNLGWSVEKIPWKKDNINWNIFETVIVRSTWDYQSDPDKFLKVLNRIDESSARLENSLSILKWNMNKNYLHHLENKGIKIVDTIWEKHLRAENLDDYYTKLNSDEIIIKPNISGNADNTFRIKRSEIHLFFSELEEIFNNREFMVQPFNKNIITEGEYSLFYFGGKYSHSILKTPKENDFRVQEEHGGIINSVEPRPEQITSAESILARIKPLPLYARIDLVRTAGNNFALMELELIEPSLYFNMNEESPIRFAKIFNEWMKS
jgi:hypothetical protein